MNAEIKHWMLDRYFASFLSVPIDVNGYPVDDNATVCKLFLFWAYVCRCVFIVYGWWRYVGVYACCLCVCVCVCKCVCVHVCMHVRVYYMCQMCLHCVQGGCVYEYEFGCIDDHLTSRKC